MLTRNNCIRAIAALCILLLSAFVSSETRAASIQTYTSLSDWQTAVAGSEIIAVRLNRIRQDTPFSKQPVTVGVVTLRQHGGDSFGNFRNFIDVPPLRFSDNNGATNIALYTKYGVSTVSLAFRIPVYAIGARFFGAQTSELENLVLYGQNGIVLATVPVTVDTGFFGIVVSPPQAVRTMRFESQIQNPDPSIGQGFSLENVVLARYKP